MKQLHVRHQTSVADPLRHERLRRALAISMDYQEAHHASCSIRPSVNAQSTTGRYDRQSDSLTPSLHWPTGVEPVTHA